MYLEDALLQFSGTTHLVVLGFSFVSVLFMKEQIGTGAAIMYFPVMVGCALLSNYLFWNFEIFRGDQDVERVFTATILGMMFSLLVLIAVNRVRDHYASIPVRFVDKQNQA